MTRRVSCTRSPGHPVTVFLLVLLWSGLAWACPLCKEALFDPAQARQLAGTAKGYAVSIALLLGVPLLMIGGIAAAIFRSRRR